MSRVRLIGIIGGGAAGTAATVLAGDVGRAVARLGYGVVCGGLGGVMEAACRGAARVAAGDRGPIVGILPGYDSEAGNPCVEVVIPTGIGLARNVLVVASADAVVAIDGESGTLSEIALAWQMGKPVAALAGAGGWAEELAGSCLDDRSKRPIARLADVDALRTWLDLTLES